MPATACDLHTTWRAAASYLPWWCPGGLGWPETPGPGSCPNFFPRKSRRGLPSRQSTAKTPRPGREENTSYNGQHWNFPAQPSGDQPTPTLSAMVLEHSTHPLEHTQVPSRVSHRLSPPMLLCAQCTIPSCAPGMTICLVTIRPSTWKQDLSLNVIYISNASSLHTASLTITIHPIKMYWGLATGHILFKVPSIQKWAKKTQVPAFMELRF